MTTTRDSAHPMPRPMLADIDPEGFKAVVAIEKHLRSRIDPALLELVWLRASIVNGCAFCVDLHGRTAQRAGESVDRLLALSAWRESPSFTQAERAALALTDAVTSIADGVDDHDWQTAVDHYGDGPTVDLVFAIALINVWNRVAVATQVRPPVRVSHE